MEEDTKNNPRLHFSGSKTMQRSVESDNAQNNNLGLRARSWFLRRPWGSGIILYTKDGLVSHFNFTYIAL